MTGRDLRVGPFDDTDRYFVDRQVGVSGAEGQLYKGRDRVDNVDWDVAIKVLLSEHDAAFDTFAERWAIQEELLHNVQNPGLVHVRKVFQGPPVHQAGLEVDGRCLYLVMNWIDGIDLEDWFARHPDAPPRERLALLAPIASVLDELHSGDRTKGFPLVHRDVKPSNIIVHEIAGPVLVDVGLLRRYDPADHIPDRAGTPGYRAPEVERTGAWSPASDRYALGAVAFYLLTGMHPQPQHEYAWLARGLRGSPAVTAQPHLADEVLAMLDEDPQNRPTSAVDWLRGLRSQVTVTQTTGALPPPFPVPAGGSRANPKSRHRARRAVATVFALVALAALAFAIGHRSSAGQAVSTPPTATTQRHTSASIAPKSHEVTAPRSTEPKVSTPPTEPPTTRPPATEAPTTSPPTTSPPPPQVEFLSDLPPLGDNPQTGPENINGTTYAHSIYDVVDGCRTSHTWNYDLGRRNASFDAVVGMDDSSKSNTTTQVRVLLDGAQAWGPVTVALGRPAIAHVSTSGRLRLSLEMTEVTGDFSICGGDGTIAWGDARITR